MSIPRIVVPDTGDEEAALKLCLGYAMRLVDDPKSKIERVLLLVHTKRQLTDTSLPTYLGKAQVTKLAANDAIGFGRVQMRAATLKTLSSIQTGTVIIAFWADGKMMDEVDGLMTVGGVVAYPWPKDGLDAWIATWNPDVHGQHAAKLASLITDPIVETALKSLTGLVNLGNKGLHAHYKDMADRFLRVLRAQKHPLEPEKIRQWAIRNRWNPDLAGDLEKMARKVADLKTKPSLNSIERGQETYQRWQAAVKSAGSPPPE